MNICGLGVDLVKVSRLAGLIHRRGLDAFTRKILSPPERVWLAQRFPPTTPHEPADVARYMAVRWAIKEAVYKALPHRVDWHQVRVTKSDRGAPQVLLDAEVSLVAGGVLACRVSVAHEEDLVVASAISFLAPPLP